MPRRVGLVLTEEERLKVLQYCRLHPGKSGRQIAKDLDVSHTAVLKIREEDPPVQQHLVEPKKVNDELLAKHIHTWLKAHKREVSLDEISSFFDVGIARVKTALERLRTEAKSISILNESRISAEFHPPPSEPTRIDIKRFAGKEFKFGVTADNHLCSKYYRDDVLHALFDIWESQGVEAVYQGGNMIDGEAPFNKHDLLVRGLQEQVDYFIDNWPWRKGITTHFVTGDDHEGWYVQREGINIGEFISLQAQKQGRSDLIYQGHMEHDVQLEAKYGKASIRNMHAGGGSSYATSYSVQKIVESYTGGEKPQVMFVGHFHKAEYTPIRNVHVVQAGCTEDQTPFMRKKRLQAHIGGWTVTFTVDPNGVIHNFTPQFHNFYDREFYEQQKNWKYLYSAPAKRGRG